MHPLRGRSLAGALDKHSNICYNGTTQTLLTSSASTAAVMAPVTGLRLAEDSYAGTLGRDALCLTKRMSLLRCRPPATARKQATSLRWK